MDLRSLEPRGEAMIELVRLAGREQELRSRVGEVERGARAASEERTAAREALAELERHAASEQVSAQARRKAEDRVATAEEAIALWPPRIQGAERAAQDGRRAVAQHITEHFDEIKGELEENGATAAETVNASAESFLLATARRTEAERNLIEVTALTRRMGLNDVTRAASDEAVQAVRSFIQRGGEVAPVLTIAETVTVS